VGTSGSSDGDGPGGEVGPLGESEPHASSYRA
jgi:hypothetical protein